MFVFYKYILTYVHTYKGHFLSILPPSLSVYLHSVGSIFFDPNNCSKHIYRFYNLDLHPFFFIFNFILVCARGILDLSIFSKLKDSIIGGFIKVCTLIRFSNSFRIAMYAFGFCLDFWINNE